MTVGKWSASSWQNTLEAALNERGTLRRTIRAAKYLSDPAYRRKIARQLNKGESRHALRRDLHYAQQGTIGKPLLTDQTEQAWCLTVPTNAVITWTTEYYQLAVQDLRAKGRAVPGELLVHISPAHAENVDFFGVITVDVEAELAKLDTGGTDALNAAGFRRLAGEEHPSQRMEEAWKHDAFLHPAGRPRGATASARSRPVTGCFRQAGGRAGERAPARGSPPGAV